MPWVEENSLPAQVTGGGLSLRSDLINLIKASLLSAWDDSLGCATEGTSKMSLFILMSVTRANHVPKEAAAEAKNHNNNKKSIGQWCVNCVRPFANVM